MVPTVSLIKENPPTANHHVEKSPDSTSSYYLELPIKMLQTSGALQRNISGAHTAGLFRVYIFMCNIQCNHRLASAVCL